MLQILPVVDSVEGVASWSYGVYFEFDLIYSGDITECENFILEILWNSI